MGYLGASSLRPFPARTDERPKSAQALFAFRLRLHRERHRLPLSEIATVTRIRRERLEELESGDLSRWPRGLFARAWVRSYAVLVGLDADDTLDEFCRLFPHGDRRAREALREIAAIVGQRSEYREEAREADRRRRGAVHPEAAPPVRAALRPLQWVFGVGSR
ncbi:MAG: hypothetical protein A3I61_11565 [Acidobacteria bacterium RIFCSPLOWO2_02_FULL_68_18]|nr:MAG: hypothetical protein A3I61_11565 [Acidobacteria bacterium RIFCSPLOWO2_02_FULL_68_18]OFW50699.1 MAG: hypothetical protein A3G77_17315 [Acidobacteria bacterium RIFCSPLOWO2_12_FULL_68_19]